MPTNTDGVQEQPVSTEQDSARRLAEIRERAEKATPGPWENRGGMVGSPGHRAICGMLNVTGSAEMDIRDDPAYANASFIAHSREDVPYLLSIIDSLTAERDNAVWRADRLDDAGRVQQSRAEAATPPSEGQ